MRTRSGKASGIARLSFGVDGLGRDNLNGDVHILHDVRTFHLSAFRRWF